MPDALDLLRTRRSLKPNELAGPGPSAVELDTLLTIASRVPDHGKLTPWRFIVFEGDARMRAGEAIAKAYAVASPSNTMKRQGVSFQWSGTRDAMVRRVSSSSALGPGPASSLRLRERRVRSRSRASAVVVSSGNRLARRPSARQPMGSA